MSFERDGVFSPDLDQFHHAMRTTAPSKPWFDYYSHGKQFIQNLPIPVPTESERDAVEAAVKDLIETLTAVEKARTPHQRTRQERRANELKTLIESLISALFGLSDADVELARAVPVPT
jgi:hypothetical protein